MYLLLVRIYVTSKCPCLGPFHFYSKWIEIKLLSMFAYNHAKIYRHETFTRRMPMREESILYLLANGGTYATPKQYLEQ